MTPDIAEARQRAKILRDSLPTSIEVAAIGVLSKAPYQLLCTRESLVWRTEELARNACDALERDDLAVAAILTRAVTESAALVWKLKGVLEARDQHTAQELNDILMRLLAGSKKWREAPDPFNILTCIDRMDKKVPGVRASYDTLSEFAHPNWSGVSGLFSKTDKKKFTTYFGRGLKDVEKNRGLVATLLVASLGLFEYAYNWLSDAMPAFLAELESIWSEGEQKS